MVKKRKKEEREKDKVGKQNTKKMKNERKDGKEKMKREKKGRKLDSRGKGTEVATKRRVSAL
jgi:hypothetical protein